ncbi:TPA: carbohydrate ABC transporter substrate-binding protein [Kluyvera ascorbata]|uniref:ABC transporter substrate-binding protein n=1 Tax=Kluyvera ascorbata TaxID=51288 RepID=UPI0018A3760E|nr:ABC transporter substrate-binding protein [Kluyvera ascorbata]BBV66874.1 sugar ABC transporter substrate-binding protein [Klebsiella sp. STW0522-44]MDU3912656.1 ABC transporter substrate-binding protein [Kluyvera ascorbata]MDZ4030355.1 ABC transporter substrate-binding protein [Kluyvera ascorbata]HAT7512470.1 carbohydrate ABC transporter substrate-binding protein [Kluyvera ascorbata]HCL5621513.1 carbohydrate ABC transporter substrate-binding protein [Kluyvera ascorbata]
MKKSALFLLACCGFGAMPIAHSADQVELRFAWWGGKARNQATLKALDAFEAKYPNIKVKAEYTGWDGFYSRLTTQINSNTEADVIQTNWNWLTLLSKTGDGFYDLNKLRQPIGLDQYSPAALASTTVNGKVNAIPISANVMLFYYNAATWQKAGVPLPKSWDDLLKAGPVFKEKLGDSYYPLILTEQDSLLLLNSWVYQGNQKPMVDEKTRKLGWNHDDLVQAFTFYRQLVAAHAVPDARTMASYGKGVAYEMKPWINGEWGGIYNWNVLYTAESQNLSHPDDLVMGDYPMREGAKDAGQFNKTALMLSISKNTRHPQEAALLINFLMSEKEGVVPVGLERGVPLSKAGAQILRDAGLLKEDDPVLTGLTQSASLPNHAKALPYLEDPQFTALFLAALQSIDYGKATVDQAATRFEEQANRILRRIMR